jgi:hypothetical protein
MRLALVGVLFGCAVSTATSHAQDFIPPETLRQRKNVTVFITVEIGGERLREYGVLPEKPLIEHLLPLPQGRALLLNTSRGGLLVELPE